MALFALGDAASESVRRGVEYLLRTQQYDGSWRDELLDRHRFSAGLLPPVSSLCDVFPALGPVPVPPGGGRVGVADGRGGAQLRAGLPPGRPME